MKVHHIGYVVKDVIAAVKAFKVLGWVVTAEPSDDVSRNISIAFLSNGQYVVEFIATLNPEHSSPVDFLSKVKVSGNGIPYHLCYECNCLEQTVAELENTGYRQINQIAPAPAIDDRNVVFLLNQHIGLIELIERGDNQ